MVELTKMTKINDEGQRQTRFLCIKHRSEAEKDGWYELAEVHFLHEVNIDWCEWCEQEKLCDS